MKGGYASLASEEQSRFRVSRDDYLPTAPTNRKELGDDCAVYRVDPKPQMQSVLSGQSSVVSYQYDLNGNRLGKTLGNNTTANYAFDDASRLLSLVHSNSVGVLARFDYTLNAVGNRTNKTQSGTGVSPVRSESYTYDAIDQIAAVAYATNSTPMRNVSYQYDPVGNRQQVTEDGNTTGYTANDLNQYTVVDGSSLTYDTKGNLWTTVGGLLGSWTYTYDAQNRLVSASGGPSFVTATFAYDARNRCVSRTINGVTTYLAYDGWSLLEERNANGGLLAEYIHGATIDEILQRTTGTGAVYYHHDGLGSTIVLTDSQGLIAESYQYDVFGTPSFFDSSFIPQTSSLQGNRFLFTGREWLPDLGLYDYRNRFYSATLGRFLQTDPIGFDEDDLDLYTYAGGNPVDRVDPSGLSYEKPKGVVWSPTPCPKGQETRFIQIVHSRGRVFTDPTKEDPKKPYYPQEMHVTGRGKLGVFSDNPGGLFGPVKMGKRGTWFEVCRVCVCEEKVKSCGPCKRWMGGDSGDLDEKYGPKDKLIHPTYPAPTPEFIRTVNNEYPGTL
jgi:RHS repeat-associated protein